MSNDIMLEFIWVKLFGDIHASMVNSLVAIQESINFDAGEPELILVCFFILSPSFVQTTASESGIARFKGVSTPEISFIVLPLPSLKS